MDAVRERKDAASPAMLVLVTSRRHPHLSTYNFGPMQAHVCPCILGSLPHSKLSIGSQDLYMSTDRVSLRQPPAQLIQYPSRYKSAGLRVVYLAIQVLRHVTGASASAVVAQKERTLRICGVCRR
jgi:hypothetical protein